jgi:hypothetical protein
MPKQVTRLSLSLLGAVVANVALAGDWHPSLPYLDTEIAFGERMLNDPEHGFEDGWSTLTKQQQEIFTEGEAANAEVWCLEYRKAVRDLLVGDFASYDDRLLRLETLLAEYVTTGGNQAEIQHRVENAAMLYVWCIEADLQPVDPERFGALVALGDPKLWRDNKWPIVEISLSFAKGDISRLQRAAGGGSSLAPFEQGYAKLLLAKLDSTRERIADAIQSLEETFDASDEDDNGTRGRVALHLAQAYWLRTQLDGQKASLEKATRYAELARTRLEYLEAPLFWASAHRVTAEVLETMRDRIPPYQFGPIDELTAKIKRAYRASLL